MTLDMTFEHREEIIRREEHAEGKAEGKAESIMELLEDYGEVPRDVVSRIMEETDLTTLSKWLKLAAHCSSVDEFVSKM